MSEYIKTGFVTRVNSVQEKPITIPSIAKIDITDTQQAYRSVFDLGLKSYSKEKEIRDMVDRGVRAYIKDSMYKNAVDKLAESFADFNLEGTNPKAVMYLKTRLEEMSQYSREYWKTLFSRCVTSYFKTGNVMLLKLRGRKMRGAIRPLYQNKPYAVTAVFLCSPSDLEPAYNTTREIVGWTYRSRSKSNNEVQKTLILNDAVSLPKDLAYINFIEETTADVSKALFYPLVDIAHVAYTKPEGIPWGVGPMLPAIEDLALLRTAESTVALMMKKFSNPFIHHIIEPRGGAQSSIQADINNMYMTYRKMAPEGLLITGPNHQIKILGGESHALRMEGYLEAFTNRAAGGLASSPFGLGLTPGNQGSAEAFNEMLKSKITKCQKDFSREIGFQLFWEILWEGGFDPFNNDNDRVHLTFEQIDVDAIIKEQAHHTYLWQSNVATWEEVREKLKLDPNVSKAGLYSNVFPGNQKDPTNPAGQSTKKVPKNNAEIKQILKDISPRNFNEVRDFLTFTHRLGFATEENSFEIISKLIGDEDAICEYILQLEKSSI